MENNEKKINISEIRNHYKKDIVHLLKSQENGHLHIRTREEYVEESISGEINAYIGDGVLHEMVVLDIYLDNDSTFVISGVDFVTGESLKVYSNEYLAVDDLDAVFWLAVNTIEEQDSKESIYVVKAQTEGEGEVPDSYVVGAYKSLKYAQEAMRNEYSQLMESWFDEDLIKENPDDYDIEKSDYDMICTSLISSDCISVRITETKLND